jgi:bis(5'-nucleosyl)-tetraphosphatase (symmetrical)|tara:strand:- start:33025 stop:33840 length:816 start_codon:yes stop_codon:yes gene_type:complete
LIYAVGDIQGCYDELRLLLDKIQFDPDKDVLWSCGDMVNRGPKSLQTLRFCKSLGDSFVNVLGNHDLHIMAVARGHKKSCPTDTFQKIFDASDREELLNWMHKMPLFHYDKNHNVAMVHAGVPPQWGLKKCLKYSAEISKILTSNKCDDFFSAMYGNKPDIWNKSLEAPDRWRLITNYFTRMRFCDPKGRLELTTKSSPDTAPKGFAPWYCHESKLMSKMPLLFGHWASLMGESGNKRAIALDTGCAWGGALTACKISAKFPRISVNAITH